MSKNPGGRSQVVFETVTEGGGFEVWLGGKIMIPVASTISAAVIPTPITAAISFRK